MCWQQPLPWELGWNLQMFCHGHRAVSGCLGIQRLLSLCPLLLPCGRPGMRLPLEFPGEWPLLSAFFPWQRGVGEKGWKPQPGLRRAAHPRSKNTRLCSCWLAGGLGFTTSVFPHLQNEAGSWSCFLSRSCSAWGINTAAKREGASARGAGEVVRYFHQLGGDRMAGPPCKPCLWEKFFLPPFLADGLPCLRGGSGVIHGVEM